MTIEDERKEFVRSFREQQNEFTPFQRICINAGIIAGITFLSTLSIDFPPGAQNVWAASIAALLALLTQLKTITEVVAEQKPKRPLGMLI